VIESLLKKTASQLDKAEISYMIIGGQAVLLYGSPRLTRDIDITVGVDSDRYQAIAAICKRLGLKILVKQAADFTRKTKVLPAEDPKSKIRIDFIFSFTPYEKKALSRTKQVRLKGYPVRFASCEDVVIHKLFAGRAIDEQDVVSIFIKNKRKIDRKYIKRTLAEFAKLPGQEKILQRFNHLWKEA